MNTILMNGARQGDVEAIKTALASRQVPHHKIDEALGVALASKNKNKQAITILIRASIHEWSEGWEEEHLQTTPTHKQLSHEARKSLKELANIPNEWEWSG